MEIPITIKLDVTDADIEDIWDIAVYGGITYWCDDIKVYQGGTEIPYKNGGKQLVSGCKFVLYDDMGNSWELTKQDIYKGIALCAEKWPWHLYYEVDKGVGILDTSSIDSIDADSIIQASCMGKIIFG